MAVGSWVSRGWLEPRFVTITATAILLSYVSEQLGAPTWLVAAFNLASYISGGFFGAKTAISSILQLRLDVDVLMVLAALGAAIVGQWREGAILLFLFSLSNVLQTYAIGRSRQAIRSLLSLYPEEAKVRRSGGVVTVDQAEVKVGDIILIESVEQVLMDGLVRRGSASVDEIRASGVKTGVTKGPGDPVLAGSTNREGILEIEVTREAEDTDFARRTAPAGQEAPARRKAQAKAKRASEVTVVRMEDLRIGDLVLIEPGERIPVDGLVRAGRSSVDQSPITGESMPVDKFQGDRVFAGTLNMQGILDVEVTRHASETTLARIIKLVEEAQESKAPTERFLKRFEQSYTTLVLTAVGLLIILPPLLGVVDFQSNFYRAMVLMTVASPCALMISVPASFIAAIASAARSGILLKGGKSLEDLALVKLVAFDKTGTLTIGKPSMTDVVSCSELRDSELLSVAAAVESRSEHPLAQAVVEAAASRGLSPGGIQDFEAVPGKGVVSKVDGKVVWLGSTKYLEQRNPLPPHLTEVRRQLESAGKMVVGVVREGQCEDCGGCDYAHRSYDWMGMIAMADQVRPEAAEAVANLKAENIEVAMLTGDNPRVARAISSEAGIDRVHAGLMPEEKVEVLKHLQAAVGPVAMVGDGVNDAPALATADVGVAMGAAGTDVALETADVVLMGDRLDLMASAIEMSRRARRVVWQNIFFSLAVIVLLITGALTIGLALPLAVLGHEGSTLIVVLNGLISLLLIPEWRRRKPRRHEFAAQVRA